MSDESDALTDQGWDAIVAEEERERDRKQQTDNRKALYQKAKAAKTGTMIVCPVCGKKFRKKSYQQAFCRNKGKGNCKDSYHNRASEKRLNRAKAFNNDGGNWRRDNPYFGEFL